MTGSETVRQAARELSAELPTVPVKVVSVEEWEAIVAALRFYSKAFIQNAEGDFSTPGLSRTWMEPSDELWNDQGQRARDVLRKMGL